MIQGLGLMPNHCQEFNSLTVEHLQRRNKMHEICRQYSRSPSKGNLKRLKSLFRNVGKGVFIGSGFYCDYGDKISLGDRVYMNINCTLLDGALITIGDDCLIGPNVQVLTINHALSPRVRLKKANFASDVILENNVWLGAGAIVLPGVTVHSGAVIGAGSIVTDDCDNNYLYAGNPARKIKQLD